MSSRSLREIAKRQVGVGQVDSLAAADESAVDDAGEDGARCSPHHLELDQAVVDQHPLAALQVAEDLEVVDRQLDLAAGSAEAYRLATAQPARAAGDLAQPIARAHQVEDDRHVVALGVGDSAHQAQAGAAALGVRAVRQIESNDVDPRAQETSQHGLRFGGRTESREDLRSARGRTLQGCGSSVGCRRHRRAATGGLPLRAR